MNKDFLPNETEQDLILLVQEFIRNDFALIRMTDTMLSKSIIDASYEIRMVMKDAGLVDYSTMQKGQGGKLVLDSAILSHEGVIINSSSFYRPNTKLGDPRFWIYNFKNIVRSNDLVYFTVYEGQFFAIPLTNNKQELRKLLEVAFSNAVESELISKLRDVLQRGWIPSIAPNTYPPAPKDVGETLETILGITSNNHTSADFKGQIELKTKSSKQTNSTLFSCVPNWGISQISSSADMILTYGYKSNKYEDFCDLYVTVTNKPNNQGLFLKTNDEENLLLQNHINSINSITKETCKWEYAVLKDRLNKKHPKTAWITAERKQENGITYFRYTEIEITHGPIFTQFLLMIEQGLIVFDWRGRVKYDKSGYKDKGHAFRLKPRAESLLFGSTVKISLT